MGLVAFSRWALRMLTALPFLSSPTLLSSVAIHRTCWSVCFGEQQSPHVAVQCH
ncbi:hypothetical protein I79_023466 [Cricetulus griseus]|uniref:Uncharacterized protein n=1 Tax=Cricetulus griseus TaxID=10029 RepID=G3II05_CRIGR|nr:hypothetical protein I79_023466 [Cricetulus griseus]